METITVKRQKSKICSRCASIMNRVEKVYDVTVQLKEILDQEVTSNIRESVIQQINELLEHRGSYLEELTPPYSDEEKNLGNKLIPINQSIEKQLQELFQQLKVEMKQFNKQKKSNQTYRNPYKDVQTMDGMFLDKKK